MEELKIFFKDVKIILKNDFLGVVGTLFLMTMFSGCFYGVMFLLLPTTLFLMLCLLRSGFNYKEKVDKQVYKVFLKSQLIWGGSLLVLIGLIYLLPPVDLPVDPPITVHSWFYYSTMYIIAFIFSVLTVICFMFNFVVDYSISFFTQGTRTLGDYIKNLSNLPPKLFLGSQLVFVSIAFYSNTSHNDCYKWIIPVEAFLNIYFTYKYLLGNDLQPKKKTVKVKSTKDEHELQFV